MSEIAKLYVSIGAKTDEFKKNMGGVQQTMGKVGAGMVSAGKTMTKAITLPLVGIGVAAFKMGKDFEAEMSKIVGLVGVASSQVDQWGRDILQMAPALGKAPRELAEALFFVTSAGLRGAEAMDVLEMSAKASAAGLGETKTIADLVTSAINAYGAENLSAGEATDILVGAVREGKAEASALAATMGSVLPIASEMGITFDQVGAAQAAMTRTGTDAATAATQLRAIMVGLMNPASQVEETLAEMGTSAAELRQRIREDGLITVLGDLRQMTADNNIEMTEIFPNVRALAGALDLVGANADENVAIFDSLGNATGALDHAFDAAADTADFKWNQAIAGSQAAAIELWQVLQHSIIPVMESVTEKITDLTKWFRELDDAQRESIIKWAMIAAAIGPVLILGGKLIGVIVGITKVVQGLTIAKVLLLGKIGLVIAAIGALVAAGIYLYRNWDEIKVQLIAAWEMIRGAAVAAAIGVKQAWYGAQKYLYGVTQSILDAIAPLIQWLPDSLTRGFDRMRAQVGQKLGQLQGDLDDLSTQAEENFARVRSAMAATSYTATETSNKYADQLSLMGRVSEVTANDIGFSMDEINDDLGGLAGDVQGYTGDINDALGSTGSAAKQLAEEMGTAAEEISANYQQVTSEISLTRQIMEAEYDLMAESMAGVMDESDKLLLQLERLSDELALQEKSVVVAKAAYEAMKKELGENAKATKELYLEYIKAEKEHHSIRNALDETREAHRLLTDEINRQGESMQEIQSEAQRTKRVIEQEFRLIELQMRNTGTEMDIMREKNDMLGQQLDIQANLTMQLRNEYQHLSITMGENAEETRKAYEEWLEAAIAQEQLKKSIEETTKAMYEQTKTATLHGGEPGMGILVTDARGTVAYGDFTPMEGVDYSGFTGLDAWESGDFQQFDTGGIVPGPRGMPRIVIAHGGETILPTHKPEMALSAYMPEPISVPQLDRGGGEAILPTHEGGFGNGNLTVNVTGNHIASDYDVDRIGEKLVDKIRNVTGLRI